MICQLKLYEVLKMNIVRYIYLFVLFMKLPIFEFMMMMKFGGFPGLSVFFFETS